MVNPGERTFISLCRHLARGHLSGSLPQARQLHVAGRLFGIGIESDTSFPNERELPGRQTANLNVLTADREPGLRIPRQPRHDPLGRILVPGG